MSREKTAKLVSDDYSSIDVFPTTEEYSLNGLPEALILFDPHKYKPGKLAMRFRVRRSRERNRERRSAILLVESELTDKFHNKKIKDIN